MSHDQFSALSNQAVAACAVVYFLAVLCHLWQWSLLRRTAPAAQVSAPETVPEMAAVGGGGSPAAPPSAEAVEYDERPALFGRVGVALTVVAVAVHAVAVVARGLAADPVRVPWGNMYEFTLTATMVVGAGYLLLYKRFSLDWLSPVVTGFILVTLMADVLLLYNPVTPLRDALDSPWLVIHVVAAIIATGAFTIGGMASGLYLIKEWRQRVGPLKAGGYLDRMPGLDALDRLAYRVQAFAFPVWTFAALIAGPIWAQHAWGSYWNWDPKEVWALITWVVYAAYLHARVTAGWKGRAAAIVALIGLATLWFNFVGINYFFGSGSMHSYAGG